MPSFGKLVLALSISLTCACAADMESLSLLAPDSAVVVGINVQSVHAWGESRSLISAVDKNRPEFRKFIELTGFDPTRDLDEILIGGPAGQGKRGLMVIRGRFDPDLVAKAARSGSTTAVVKGVTVFTNVKRSQQPASFACLDSSLAVMGDSASVRAAILRRGSPVRLNPDVVSKISELENRFDIWFYSASPVSDLASKLPESQMKTPLQGAALKQVERAGGGVKLGTNLRFEADLVTRTENDATALANGMRFLIGMLQSGQNKSAAPFARVLNDLELTADARNVRIGLTVSEQDITRAVAAIKSGVTQRLAGKLPAAQSPASGREPAAEPASTLERPPANSNEIMIYSSPKDMGTVKLPGAQQ